jgi:hypothetical protein
MVGRGRPQASATSGAVDRRRRAGLVWAVAVAGAWIAAALYLTQVAALPRALRQDLDDTAAHLVLGVVVAGCFVCVIWSLGWRGRRLLVGGFAAALASMAFLVGTELLQAPSLARQPELSDALADVAGALLVAVVLFAAFRARPPVPELVANGFLGVASLTLATLVALVLVSPPAPVRERSDPGLQAAVLEPACRTGLVRADGPPSSGIVTTEPAVQPLWRFNLSRGLDQVEGTLPPVRLETLGSVAYQPGAGAIFAGGRGGLTSSLPADDLLAALAERQRFSVDAWVDLAAGGQSGPARIVALADGTRRDQSVFHLGVEGEQLSVRLRSGCDATNPTLVDGLGPGRRHVALTYDDGRVQVFIDGQRRVEYQLDDADLGHWLMPVPLNIGNEKSQNRPLRGTVSVVSFWPEPLPADQVAWLASDLEAFSSSGS